MFRNLRDALEIARNEIEITAKEHLNLSQKIKNQLEQQLNDFIIKQKEQRKSQQLIVEKSLRNKQNQAALVQKVVYCSILS